MPVTQPSDTELAILKLFWLHGPMSAREAQGHAGPELGWADSTTNRKIAEVPAGAPIAVVSPESRAIRATSACSASGSGSASATICAMPSQRGLG